MGASSKFVETEVEVFVWRTLSPSIAVIVDFAGAQHDTMDPEALHDFRVAVRRLRSDLRSLRPFLDRPRADALRAELAGLDEVVRPVRDGDVMIERLTAAASRVPNPIDPDIVEALHHALTVGTDGSRRALRSAFEAGTYDVLFSTLSTLRDSGLVRTLADDGFRAALEARNKQLWRRVRRAAEALGPEADDEALHRLRVLVKRSRYLAEASAEALERWARRRARAGARIQSVLGEHQDSVVFSRWLLAQPQPTSAWTLGVDALLAAESEDRRRLRRRWHKTWRRIERRVR